MKMMWIARWWQAALVMACTIMARDSVAKEEPVTFPAFLQQNEIDLSRREALSTAAEWNDAAEAVAVKVLRRFNASERLTAEWPSRPVPRADKGESVVVDDTLFAIRGRAIFVAPHRLAGELAERYGDAAYDVVRVVADGGLVVDVITPAAPAGWPRWKSIDEPTATLGLPLSIAAAPRPDREAVDGEASWPAEKPGVLVAASGLAWFPDTVLGRLGMNYSLFDTVVDGKKLVKGDTEAFYAVLAAAGKTSHKNIADAAGKPIDVMLLIDPGQKWLPSHRGDPVVIIGNAMRATRVAIDDPAVKKLVGSDHYWEIFAFVETALLEVKGHIQNSYPIVCCVRELPEGMPSGERINERVEIAGFALKRYSYVFEETRPNESGVIEKGPSQRVTTLLIGPKPRWFPASTDSNTQPIWVIAAVAALVAMAAIVGVGLLYGNRSLDRAIQKSREEFPARIELPPGNDPPGETPPGER